jgi:hypothetical protein
MNKEPLNAENAGPNREEGRRKPYHSPELVNLGPMQSLIQSTAPTGSFDGGVVIDGTAS